jgi:hypothetical protein
MASINRDSSRDSRVWHSVCYRYFEARAPKIAKVARTDEEFGGKPFTASASVVGS